MARYATPLTALLMAACKSEKKDSADGAAARDTPTATARGDGTDYQTDDGGETPSPPPSCPAGIE